MAQRILTPKQRGELAKIKRTQRQEANHQRIANLFGTKELRGLILTYTSFFDQIQFNKVSKQWSTSLRSGIRQTNADIPSVFTVLHDLYRSKSCSWPGVCYNPVTATIIDGCRPENSRYRAFYHLVLKLEELDNGDDYGKSRRKQ